jgi:archaeosine-15-forming tRNA-guanine transglycosylase
VLGAAAALEGEERWTVEKVLAMHKEGGVTVSKMLEEPQRRLMLRKEMDKKLNDGKGVLLTCYTCYF